ncbi:MAG: hypothetical protein WCW52_07290 [Elusimicrobiales bacterium]|jgi:hypothetical protein
MKKIITIVAMLGVTGGAYAAESAMKTLTDQAKTDKTATVIIVPDAPQPEPTPEEMLQKIYQDMGERFQSGGLVTICNLTGGNPFGVRQAEMISMDKEGKLKRGQVYLSVVEQDKGRLENAEPVYGVSAKLNNTFAYEADYVPAGSVALKNLKMSVSPNNKGTASVAVREIDDNGKKMLIAMFTEKFVSDKGDQEFSSYALLDPR